jgi:hypothetical protein
MVLWNDRYGLGARMRIKIPTLTDADVSNKGRYYGIYYAI